MSALDHVLLSPSPVNTTAALPPVSWGGGWVPPEDPFPPAPRRRRKRKSGWPWVKGGGSDRAKWEGKEAVSHLNASYGLEELLAFNITAEDVDYMYNISMGRIGDVQWRGRSGGGIGYAYNAEHRRHNASTVQRRKKSKSDESCYCGNSESLLRRMALAYRPLHSVAALTVCALGTLANALNVAVLTRPHLAPAPVNRILTAIAAADAALMAEYAAFAIIVWIPHSKAVRVDSSLESPTMTPAEEAARAERDFPFAAAAFVLFHMHFSQVLHTVSICLTLTLAVWRLLALRLPPEKARILCSRRRCSVALAVSVLLPPLLCSPSYLVFGITTTNVTMGAEQPLAAAQEDFSVPPVDYKLDSGLLLPTVTLALDEREGFSINSLPSTPTEFSHVDWTTTPREEEEMEWMSSQPPPPALWAPPVSPIPSTDWPMATPHPPQAVAVLYHLDLSDVAKGQDEMLYIVNFWVYAVILKLIPCLVLTVISFCLVRTLCRAKSRRRTLQGQGDVKKASLNKSVPLCRWRKTKEKVTLPVATRPIPPPEVVKEKPLDDGGVWMGREEVRDETTERMEDECPEVRAVGSPTVEEEAVNLVRVEQSHGAEDDDAMAEEASSKLCGMWRLMRGQRDASAAERGEGCCGTHQSNAVAVMGAAVRRRRRRTERTTRMLVAVLILFLVTEFPQGVLGLMSGLLGRCFFRTCYHLFGDIMDLLALLNGSINFILYCAMSRQFRQTFAQLFCKHPRVLWTYINKKYPSGQNRDIDLMKNGNMGREGLMKVGTATVGGQTSQSMGEVQSTYV